ncbi:patatin-like phospholipase family protein [Mycoplasmatota bacterium]|nr:patatin-like phospholipase family protein [Mycoplasmatota bacterium]
MNVDLVFEGGGVLGISFVGAYKALSENGYKVIRCAGTSAGSIISTLIIAGYNVQEIHDILNNTDFNQFLEKTKLEKVCFFGKGLSLFFNNGIYNSLCIETWIKDLLIKKGINTFGDIMENNESPLKIIAADITKRKMLILPDDAILYGIKPQDFPIAKAVRMSCAIPFFYTPVKIKSGKITSYVVDGGLLSSYPIWIFDVDSKPIRPTFGLKIKDEYSKTSLGKKYLCAITSDIINACINKDEMRFVRDKDLVRTIIINNDHQIKSTDFKLSEEDINYLYKMGYDSVESFVKKWNYTDYIKRFMV